MTALQCFHVLSNFMTFRDLIEEIKREKDIKTDKELADFLNITPQKLYGRISKCNGGFMFDMVKKIATK